ncbi:hypothetical protein SAMN05421503_1472 [Terribacillus aidingensis]|uniref:Uncharacterized protein n=1 Tax=Terribacillus aidingensis TaxID=586416 RepID=A0A285NM27_9BACI|nr:hypothetical protein [Terribacillus aidingensis]SNZ10017.1 hypothetical protein SAMN05421503_1472 [Terribacillus aidingensis]
MRQNKNELREAENNAVIEGVLLEKRFEDKGEGDNRALTGEIDIEVRENEVHTVSFYTKYKKNDGSENGLVKGLKTVEEEYKTVAEVGREEADKVRVDNASIRLNEYYGQDGSLRSFQQISTNFVNRVKANEEFIPRAEFSIEGVVKAVKDEISSNEPTGRKELELLVPLYGGQIIPLKFIAPEGDAAEYIESEYEKGSTVAIHGDIVNYKEIKVEKKQAAFGSDKEKVTHITKRENVITGGQEPYDEDNKNAYNPQLIAKALTEREVALEEKKNKKKDGDKGNKGKKGGFGSKASGDKKKAGGLKADDLPF